MTKEDFKVKIREQFARSDLRGLELFPAYLDTLTNIAEVAAGPLFEEIEKLKGDVNYWLDKFGLEVHKTIAYEKEIRGLLDEIVHLRTNKEKQ
jgi:hypothetical protein